MYVSVTYKRFNGSDSSPRLNNYGAFQLGIFGGLGWSLRVGVFNVYIFARHQLGPRMNACIRGG